MTTDTLREDIARRPEADVREHYARHLEDWAETDTFVRKEAAKVLTDFEVNGDSYGVPAIENIVELLVKKIQLLTIATK